MRRRSLRRPVTLVVAAAALAARAAHAQGAPGAFPVRAGVKLSADTVRVGDPFTVEVGISAPRGASIEFPSPPDSSVVVQGLDPTRVETRADSAFTVQYAYYRIAAWDIGEQPIVLADAIVQLGSVQRHVALGGHHVFVATVLPADSALRVPKPPRPIIALGAPLWWLYALIALVVALLLLGWWLWRRRRRTAVVAPPVDPFAHAEREFERVEALRLIEAGERGRYVALMVDVLREYVAARYASASLALTGTELAAALRGERAIAMDRLERLLVETDLIKFARRPVSADRARELGRDARAIVARDHAAVVASEQAAAASARGKAA